MIGGSIVNWLGDSWVMDVYKLWGNEDEWIRKNV